MIGRRRRSSSTICCCFLLFLALNTFVTESTSGKQKLDSCSEMIITNGEGEACSPLAPAPEPTSPPSEEPQPSDFQDIKLFLLYPVIQLFKSTITSDPRNITSTWVGPDICNKYMGFYCDNPPYNQSAITVASIDFNGFNLAAPSVIDFVVKFVDLALFHANSNFFGGTITSGISNLSFLYELDLSNNLFSGPFPVSVFSISRISFLDIRYNSFSGSVPKQLFFLNLQILFINNNNFVQRLPENLGSSPVSFLTLANNKFTGPIPRSIGNASLVEVLFLNNDLCGCLPYEIGFLKEATVFDAGRNRLTGPIPYSFACLKKVEQLNLAGNLLYGPVPEVVCAALGNLQNLSLSDNYFTYIGPICRKLMRKAGVEFDDRKNCIAGRPNQRPVEECEEFLMKKTHCPFFGSYYIPCMWSHSESESVPPKTRRNASPRSYAALHRH